MGREEKRETSMCKQYINQLPLSHPHNPGMCPDWESNQRPFGSQAGTQSTDSQWPELKAFILVGILMLKLTQL